MSDIERHAETERNKDVITAYLNALGTPDIDRLLGFMADDFQWVIPQSPEFSALHGARDKAQWRELYAGFLTRVPGGARYSIISLTAEDDRVAAEAESHADTPAGHFNNRYHFLFKLRDGKIVLGKEYADSLYMYMFAQKGKG